MGPRKLRSPLAVVVLGLLAEEPLHPYALRQRMSDRAHDRLPGVRPASLYDTIGRLSEAGLLTADEPSRSGRRPERVTYTITSTGSEALRVWVAEALGDPERGDEFPAALSFMFALDPDRVAGLLAHRAALVAELVDTTEKALTKAEEQDGVPPIFLSEHHYQLALRRAEHVWLVAFTQELRTGAPG